MTGTPPNGSCGARPTFYIPDDIVERIKREYRAGATLKQVAEGLNDDEVATSQGGKRWHPSTVRGVLMRHGEPTRRRGRTSKA